MIAPALARAIIVVVFCGFGAVALTFVSADRTVLATACVLALLGLQYCYFCRPSTDLRSWSAHAALLAQAGLVYLPFAVVGQAWVSLPGFLAGSVLLVLRPRWAWIAYAAVVASTGIEQSVLPGGLWAVAYISVNAATTGLYVYGLTRLARLVTVLHAARNELATLAVTHERVRFARDLHTLLGANLSAIAPRGELTLRLLRRRSAQAGHELLEILAIARRGLADLRSLARLYRDTVLDDEPASLIAMLAASDVDLRVDLDSRALSADARRRLAAVLRDGVATVLRQREPGRCEIVLRQEGGSLAVDLRSDVLGAGTSLDEVAATVAASAGQLVLRTDLDGRLHLRVTLPVAVRGRAHGPVAEPAESLPLVATRVASGVVVAALTGLHLQAQLRLYEEDRTPAELVLGAVSLLGVLALQVGWFSRPVVRTPSVRTVVLLGLMAVLAYLPWLYQDELWTGLQGFVAGSALLVLRPRWGWAVVVAVLASVAVFQVPDALPLSSDMLNFVLTLNLALLVYGLTWMARSVRQLRAAREELAEAALAEARLRFAQDLHDMLGLSLSAITLKGELAHRLLVRDPPRAAEVMTSMVELSRQALVDVRSVSSGDPELSLAQECRTAQTLLTAAGLEVQLVLDPAQLRPEVGTALATVLREAVTNVLRHSKGEHCSITVGTDQHGAHLAVVNDGAPDPGEDEPPGSGIRNMRDRVDTLGGVLTAGYEDDDRFALRVRVPER